LYPKLQEWRFKQASAITIRQRLLLERSSEHGRTDFLTGLGIDRIGRGAGCSAGSSATKKRTKTPTTFLSRYEQTHNVPD
jgi:hypothetical protein